MLGGERFSRMPTASSSASRSELRRDTADCVRNTSLLLLLSVIVSIVRARGAYRWTSPLVASSIMTTMSAVRATAMTWRPRPRPATRRPNNRAKGGQWVSVSM